MGDPATGLRWHVYRIDANRPDALQAINQLAARVIPEWLEWIEATTSDHQHDSLPVTTTSDHQHDFMPASYFLGINRSPAQLRQWIRRRRLQAGDYRRCGKSNEYRVDAIFKLAGAPAKEARQKCDAAWRERVDAFKA